MEDGTLTGAALRWTSSLSGALGMGQMLPSPTCRRACTRSPWPRRITVAIVWRSAVTILVGDSDVMLYLPLLYR